MEIFTTNFDDRLPAMRIHAFMREWLERKAKELNVKPPDIIRSLIKNEMDKEKEKDNG